MREKLVISIAQRRIPRLRGEAIGPLSWDLLCICLAPKPGFSGGGRLGKLSRGVQCKVADPPGPSCSFGGLQLPLTLPSILSSWPPWARAWPWPWQGVVQDTSLGSPTRDVLPAAEVVLLQGPRGGAGRLVLPWVGDAAGGPWHPISILPSLGSCSQGAGTPGFWALEQAANCRLWARGHCQTGGRGGRG